MSMSDLMMVGKEEEEDVVRGRRPFLGDGGGSSSRSSSEEDNNNNNNNNNNVIDLNLAMMTLDHPAEAADLKQQQQQNGGGRLAAAAADLAAPPMHGSSLRVAYQGVPGAYSEAAACKAYGGGCEPIPCDQFEVAFQSVELWLADRAVLPIENSLGGSIHRNYDLLLRHSLHIVGEVQMAVRHCLLAMPGVEMAGIERVISHPQALAQCEHTLAGIGISAAAAREAVDDTAGAAQFVAANGLRETAAIASARAARIYGLHILADGIQDDPANVTRFVLLARDPVLPRTDRPFKTSIVFAHSHHDDDHDHHHHHHNSSSSSSSTGALFKVLSAFAFRGISLTKIESRPQQQQQQRSIRHNAASDSSSIVSPPNANAFAFDYLFYIDFEASMAEPRAQHALAELREFVSFLRVLGSYPMDISPLHPLE